MWLISPPGKNWIINFGWYADSLSNDLRLEKAVSQGKRPGRQGLFGGLTLLDTSSLSLVDAHARMSAQPTKTVGFNNIQFMESVHAKSYSSIYSTLNTKSENRWNLCSTNTNHTCKRKLRLLTKFTWTVLLWRKSSQRFLLKPSFYSGFFTRSTIWVITNWLTLLKLSNWSSVTSPWNLASAISSS